MNTPPNITWKRESHIHTRTHHTHTLYVHTHIHTHTMHTHIHQTTHNNIHKERPHKRINDWRSKRQKKEMCVISLCAYFPSIVYEREAERRGLFGGQEMQRFLLLQNLIEFCNKRFVICSWKCALLIQYTQNTQRFGEDQVLQDRQKRSSYNSLIL